MVIDFISAAILIICIINGERRGVIESFASAFGWLFSLFFALFYSPSLADLLNEKLRLSLNYQRCGSRPRQEYGGRRQFPAGIRIGKSSGCRLTGSGKFNGFRTGAGGAADRR